MSDTIDPAVVTMVEQIRDRYGLRGLRDARTLIDEEIVVAERALAELAEPDEGTATPAGS